MHLLQVSFFYIKIKIKYIIKSKLDKSVIYVIIKFGSIFTPFYIKINKSKIIARQLNATTNLIP